MFLTFFITKTHMVFMYLNRINEFMCGIRKVFEKLRIYFIKEILYKLNIIAVNRFGGQNKIKLHVFSYLGLGGDHIRARHIYS